MRTWQARFGTSNLSHPQAVQYCEDLVLAGHHDWRLPSRIELITLMAVSDEASAPDFGGFPDVGQSMTSSSPVEGADPVWFFGVSLGTYKVNEGGASCRCVRSDDALSADPAPPGRVAMGDFVEDTGTGLLWERSPPLTARSFDENQAHCAQLSLGGRAGWRVPSLPELLTILELRYIPPLIDLAVFPGVEASTQGWFVADTHRAGNDGPVWSINLSSLERGGALFPAMVRCVR